MYVRGGSKGAGPRKPVWVIDKITAHMLRHTYATMLFDAGIDVKSAQRFLGHTDIEVTLSIYTHLTKFKEEQAIQMLDKHLKEIKTEPEKRLLRVL
ncbi:MAG: tyrosine-type recombinase/integrase [Clostridia bacterium]|nr:tyrosine-type recombinase/integrase [Clostridia bacterium]